MKWRDYDFSFIDRNLSKVVVSLVIAHTDYLCNCIFRMDEIVSELEESYCFLNKDYRSFRIVSCLVIIHTYDSAIMQLYWIEINMNWRVNMFLIERP